MTRETMDLRQDDQNEAAIDAEILEEYRAVIQYLLRRRDVLVHFAPARLVQRWHYLVDSEQDLAKPDGQFNDHVLLNDYLPTFLRDLPNTEDVEFLKNFFERIFRFMKNRGVENEAVSCMGEMLLNCQTHLRDRYLENARRSGIQLEATPALSTSFHTTFSTTGNTTAGTSTTSTTHSSPDATRASFGNFRR